MNKIERIRGKTRIGHTQFHSDDTLHNFPGMDVTLEMFDMWNSIQAAIIRVDANYGHIIFLGKEAGLVTAFDSNIEQPRTWAELHFLSHKLCQLQTARTTALGIDQIQVSIFAEFSIFKLLQGIFHITTPPSFGIAKQPKRRKILYTQSAPQPGAAPFRSPIRAQGCFRTRPYPKLPARHDRWLGMSAR